VHGKIRVGNVSKRTSLGNGPEPWGWTISTNLAPVFSPDHGKVPNDQRTWVKREAGIFTGTAPTLEEGLADFKERWPKFRDARAHWRVFLCAVPDATTLCDDVIRITEGSDGSRQNPSHELRSCSRWDQ
jgi:hypothetical protein